MTRAARVAAYACLPALQQWAASETATWELDNVQGCSTRGGLARKGRKRFSGRHSPNVCRTLPAKQRNCWAQSDSVGCSHHVTALQQAVVRGKPKFVTPSDRVSTDFQRHCGTGKRRDTAPCSVTSQRSICESAERPATGIFPRGIAPYKQCGSAAICCCSRCGVRSAAR